MVDSWSTPNIKLTYPEDLELIEALFICAGGRIAMIRIGQGFDVHGLEAGDGMTSVVSGFLVIIGWSHTVMGISCCML